jgi:glycosyltransferase involved in cell wall biosynthesis
MGTADHQSKLVSVIVPAYKEATYIGRTLSGIVEAFHTAKLDCEVVVVVDVVPGDETISRVAEVASRCRELAVIRRNGRRGVGTAVRDGIKNCHGNCIIIAMGDQSESPSDIIKLAKAAQNCGIVFANRFKRGKPDGYPFSKYVANRVCNIVAMILFRIPYSDITNAFKAYDKDLLDSIQLCSEGFEVFLEMPVKALTAARGVKEIGVEHVVRRDKVGKLSIGREGPRYVFTLLRLLTYRQRSVRSE